MKIKRKETNRKLNVNVGDKIEITFMYGEPQYNGKFGYVDHIDDAGQLWGTWGGCAIIPGTDFYKIIERKTDVQSETN